MLYVAVPPMLFSVRLSTLLLPLHAKMLIPPLALVTPLPLIVPPLHVSNQLTFNAPVPVMVPPLRVNVLVAFDAAASDSVPPEIVSGELVTRLLMVCVPEDNVMLNPALM